MFPVQLYAVHDSKDTTARRSPYRWSTGDEAGDTEMITGTPCAGNLVDSRLKELLPPLPVVYVKAVPVQV